MADFSMDYGGMLKISPSGDFAFASPDVALRQQVIRVLATNPREVLDDGTVLDPELWLHPRFGAGLGRVIGIAISTKNTTGLDAIESRVRQALGAVAGVSELQPPAITFKLVSGGINVVVTFTSAATNKAQTVALTVPQ